MLKTIKSGHRLSHILLVSCAAVFMLQAWPVHAQSSRDFDERIRRLEQQLQTLVANRGVSSPAAAGQGSEEAANLQARVIKLEQLVEQLNGQIEEARFKTGQMSTQLEQLSNDMNYRIAVLEQSMAGKTVAVPPNQTPPPRTGPTPQRPQAQAQAAPATSGNEPLSRPVSPQPTASAAVTAPPPITDGSVRASTPGENTFGTLQTDEAGRPLLADPNQPMPALGTQLSQPVAPAQSVPQRAPNPGPVAGSQIGVAPGVAAAVSLPEGTPKQQYDYSFDFLKRQDYASAETSFREFLKRYPKDPLSGNAQYWLGETHYVRGDYQKAAVEFLNGYQNYPKSNKAPDNLLKLGMSMANIGQTQGACTALGRLNKEYPDAGDQIRRSVQQERQKLKCQ